MSIHLSFGEDSHLPLLGLPVPFLKIASLVLSSPLVGFRVYQFVDLLAGDDGRLEVIFLLTDLLADLSALSNLGALFLRLLGFLDSSVVDPLYSKEEGDDQNGQNEDPQVVDWGFFVGSVDFGISLELL